MRHRPLPLLLALGLLAGCSDAPAESPAALAGACQFSKCDCKARRGPAVPVVWQQDGTASCPAGYTLGPSGETPTFYTNGRPKTQ